MTRQWRGNVRRSLVTAAAVACAAGLVACGGSDEEDVEQAVTDFREAALNMDAEAFCDSFSSESITDEQRDQCIQGFELGGEQIAQAAEASNPEVTDVQVDGDTATATVMEGEAESTIEFVKEDDEWKISGGSGAPAGGAAPEPE